MLENECDELQEECLAEESRFHYLNCLSGIAASSLEKVQLEEGWAAGKGKLLPDFSCIQDLYQVRMNVEAKR